MICPKKKKPSHLIFLKTAGKYILQLQGYLSQKNFLQKKPGRSRVIRIFLSFLPNKICKSECRRKNPIGVFVRRIVYVQSVDSVRKKPRSPVFQKDMETLMQLVGKHELEYGGKRNAALRIYMTDKTGM